MSDPLKLSEVDLPPQPSVWLKVGSGAMIALAVLWVGMCLFAILNPTSDAPFAFIGAICFGPWGVIFTFLQYRAVFRAHADSALIVGVALWLFAGFTVFGLVTNIGEAMIEDDTFVITTNVVLVCLIVLVLLAVIPAILGVMSFRWGRALNRYKRSTPLCIKCKYNLRGTIASGGTACPECGQSFKVAANDR